MTDKHIKLPNAVAPGATIPAIGLGTWQSPAGEVEKAVAYAIKEAGYRHIDGAWIYGNEQEVGQGIKDSGVLRGEIFITSKIWGTYHRKVEENLDQILESLGTNYVDLLLIHWPIPLNPNGNPPKIPLRPDGTRDLDSEWSVVDTWKQMEAVQRSGKALHIGVSNCSAHILDQLLPTATIKPAVNQIELHPYLPQLELLEYLKKHGIVAEAYSPLGSTDSPLLKDEVVLEIAKKHNAEPAQVLIGYLVAKDVVVLPKSVTPKRILSNGNPAQLDADEVAKLDKLSTEGGKHQRFIKPKWGFKLGFEDWDQS